MSSDATAPHPVYGPPEQDDPDALPQPQLWRTPDEITAAGHLLTGTPRLEASQGLSEDPRADWDQAAHLPTGLILAVAGLRTSVALRIHRVLVSVTAAYEHHSTDPAVCVAAYNALRLVFFDVSRMRLPEHAWVLERRLPDTILTAHWNTPHSDVTVVHPSARRRGWRAVLAGPAGLGAWITFGAHRIAHAIPHAGAVGTAAGVAAVAGVTVLATPPVGEHPVPAPTREAFVPPILGRPAPPSARPKPHKAARVHQDAPTVRPEHPVSDAPSSPSTSPTVAPVIKALPQPVVAATSAAAAVPTSAIATSASRASKCVTIKALAVKASTCP
jgi:hypothetical protein